MQASFSRKFLILGILLMASCTLPGRRVATITPPAPPSGNVLLDILKKRNGAVSSLEGKINSRIVSRGGKSSSTQLIILKRPFSLRLDALTPFGNPALTMTTDGERVSLYYHSKRRFFSGNADSRNISRIFPTSLSLGDLTLILTGGIPVIDFDRDTVAVGTKDGRYCLTLRDDQIMEDICFDVTTMEPLGGVIYDKEGRTILSITLEDYRDAGGIRMPARIKTSLPLENYTMDVRYTEMSVNGFAEESLFALQPPEGVTAENLDNLIF